ncbi:MAG: hypothetical protein R3C18_07245 [Planctomycetaceae bacterium]
MEDYGVNLLFVQESYPHDEHLPPLLFPQFRDRSVWASALPNKWGSGIFSTSGELSRISLPKYDGWVVGTSIQKPDWLPNADEILAFSIHAPDGEGSYPGQVNRILDEIAPLIDRRDAVIAGDFNLTISQFADTPIKKNNLRSNSETWPRSFVWRIAGRTQTQMNLLIRLFAGPKTVQLFTAMAFSCRAHGRSN